MGHDHAAYTATKAAIIQFTESIALKYAKKGIRCNSILPDLMDTPIVEVRLAPARTGGDIGKLIEDRSNAVPMR